jgi:hypothetical protein
VLTGSLREIGHVLDKPLGVVEAAYRDPQTQALFAREVEAKGKYALKQLTAGGAVDAVCVLRDILMNGGAKHSDRIRAAQELLDRGFGKPVPASKRNDQEDEGFVGDKPEETLAKLRAELAAKLESREKLITRTNTNNKAS